jgi:hypothetical protein
LKGVILSIRCTCPLWAIGVQSGQSQEKIMKKEDSRNHAPGNRAADCSGFCMPMKHDKPIF